MSVIFYPSTQLPHMQSRAAGANREPRSPTTAQPSTMPLGINRGVAANREPRSPPPQARPLFFYSIFYSIKRGTW